MLRLTSYGGAGKVTGSNFLIEGAKGRVLVDCGIEQGSDFCEECVYGPFAYDPASIDALVITHAHLDHVGRVPKLVKDGYRGPIYMTPPTRDLAELIWNDSVAILGIEAKHREIPALYDMHDAETALGQIELLDYHIEREVAPGLSVYLRNTGHILGSASARITDGDTAVALTGDIGNAPSPLLPDWEPVPDADVLLMESVYGDRLHPSREHRVEYLRDTLKRALARGGAVMIPAFSIERTQLMLYELSNFYDEGSLPKVPVYLDSPLAIRVTALYDTWGTTYFKPEAEEEMKREKSLFDFPFLHKTLEPRDSAAIEKVPNPKIIIAGAGMSHGGRIGRWESMYLPDPSSALLIVGYQAPGSPGRRLVDGAKRVRLGEHFVRVRGKVENLTGWSAHADRDGLLAFADQSISGGRVKTIFTALGEPSAERFLAQRIHDYLGTRAIALQPGTTWEITKEGVRRA